MVVQTAVLVVGQGGVGIGSAVGWILVLLVCCVVFGVVLMKLRKHLLGDSGAESGAMMPVAELRRLRDAGELSEEEFQRAVRVLAEQARGSGAGEGETGRGRGTG